ncbi:hypothetical protein SISNIDRAFT_467651 [Sistotremastrum niveocremeum HHB9708]|uniref:Secreted protein n=1 Tax=Sistotremastrum niveocremeum HHB9708 TaxID=1314777 RepID=A0A164SEC1_9AGAM|nr:hypothetical protein SISNIDRAFT_467651 [Sistotremastrum niveocremeum HHB9708]
MFFKPFASFFTFLAVFFSLTSLTTAKIVSIAGDGHFAKQGFAYPITFNTQTFPEDFLDFTVVLGWQTGTIPAGSVGQIAFSTIDLLSLGESNTGTGSFTVQVPLDPNVFKLTQNTVFTVTAAVTSLAGAIKEAQVNLFSTSITIEP